MQIKRIADISDCLRQVLLCLLFVCTVNSAMAIPTTPAPGIVVPIGGALRYDNDEVWMRLVELAGGKGANYVVLPTAAGNPQRTAKLIAETLSRHGAVVVTIPIAPRWPDTDAGKAAHDTQWVEKIRAANGVFLSGGAQERIVDTLAPDGSETPVLKAIRELLNRGGVVAGTSAGAAIMSSVMFRDAQDVHSILKGVMRDGKEIDRGLGFVGSEIFVDQHFLRRGRIGRMLPLMANKGYQLGLGVDENSAAIFRGGEIEIIGAKGALLVDLSTAQRDMQPGPFNISNARLSYLDHGDRYVIATRQAQASARKAEDHRLDHSAAGFKPYFDNDPFYLDILGDTTIVNAMANLMDNRYRVAVGLAFNARPRQDDMQPDLGFEFTLTRDERSSGWFTGSFGGEDYSVFNMRLDVRPVRLPHPLYVPWKP